MEIAHISTENAVTLVRYAYAGSVRYMSYSVGATLLSVGSSRSPFR